SDGLRRDAAAASSPRGGSLRIAGSGQTRKKRTFKEEREYAVLPERITALESEQQALHARGPSPEFYKEGADSIKDALARIEAIDAELLSAYSRWDELDSIKAN